jgi:hypothetical protein
VVADAETVLMARVRAVTMAAKRKSTQPRRCVGWVLVLTGSIISAGGWWPGEAVRRAFTHGPGSSKVLAGGR